MLCAGKMINMIAKELLLCFQENDRQFPPIIQSHTVLEKVDIYEYVTSPFSLGGFKASLCIVLAFHSCECSSLPALWDALIF